MLKYLFLLSLWSCLPFISWAESIFVPDSLHHIPDTLFEDTIVRFKKIAQYPIIKLDEKVILDSFDVKFVTPHRSVDDKVRPLHLFFEPDHNKIPISNEGFSIQLVEKPIYYRTRIPITEISYSMGSAQFQNLDLFHSQNLDSNLNYTFHATLMQSLGFLRNHSGTRNNIVFTLNGEYKKWMFKGHLQRYVGRFNESNGLVDPSFLEVNAHDLIAVNKTNASSETAGFIAESKVYYKLNQGENIFNAVFYTPHLHITKRTYVESGASVQQNGNPLNPLETNDFFQHSIFSQGGGYALYNPLFSIEAGAHIAFGRFFYLGPDVNFIQQFLTGSLKNRKKDFPIDYEANLKYHVAGRNITNLFIDGEAKWELMDRLRVKGNVDLIRQTPFQEMILYSSNNFNWDNDFQTVNQFQLKGSLDYNVNRISLSVDAGNQITSNLIVYTPSQPIQVDQIQNVLFTGVRYALDLGWIKNEGSVRYNLQSDDEFLRYPEYVVQNRLYFNLKLFRDKKLHIQIGAEVLYFAQMNGFTYVPELTGHAINNTLLIGNYPFVDGFFNMKIDKIKIFVRAYQVISGMLPAQSFLAQNYPVNPFHMQFGIGWRFYN